MRLIPALDVGIASPYPHLQQVVASRQARDVDPAITLTADPLASVRGLKQENGLDIWLCGGGELAGTLVSEIDRLVLKRNPVVFGIGIPLFGNAPYTPRRFDMMATRAFSSGVIIEEYVSHGGACRPSAG